MRKLKEFTAHCKKVLEADKVSVRYNDCGSLYIEKAGVENVNFFFYMASKAYPTRSMYSAADILSDELGRRNAETISGAISNFRRTPRRTRWFRRILTTALGLPRWVRPPREKANETA